MSQRLTTSESGIALSDPQERQRHKMQAQRLLEIAAALEAESQAYSPGEAKQ